MFRRAYHLGASLSARAVGQCCAGELERVAHPLQYGPGARRAQGPGLELQADDARIVAVCEGGEERPQGEAALAGEAMLVAAGQIRVGEVDVPKLAGEHRVRPHEIHLARPHVARVERDVAQTCEVLGQVAAPWSSQEGTGA